MITDRLQALTGRYLVLLTILSLPVLSTWARTEGENGEQSQTTHDHPAKKTVVSPGVRFAIQDVTISSDRRLRVTFSIADDAGLPLDRLGIATPGGVSSSFVAAHIPVGQSQYVPYTTETRTDPITAESAVLAAADTGGSYQQIGEGRYTYTFGRALPDNYDAAAAQTVTLYGQRDLTEFNLGIPVSNVAHRWGSGSSQAIQEHRSDLAFPLAGLMTPRIRQAESLKVQAQQRSPEAQRETAQVETFRSAALDSGEERKASSSPAREMAQVRTSTSTAYESRGGARSYLEARKLEARAQTGGTGRERQYTKHQLAYYLDPKQVTFVRPGLQFTIQSATIGADLKIRVTFSITDDVGLPLDRLGVYTPGAVSTSFVGAYIPNGQSQYTAYTTRTQTSPITGQSAVQAAADSGGTYQQVAEGMYTYTFGRALPANYDRTVTHTVALYGRRDLTEFDLGQQVSNVEYNWVPAGSTVTVIRDVVRTETCNKCHDPLEAHGGQRQNVALCVTCHTPQTTDPDTGNTVDFKVMVHKIHAGPELPSVQAGTPYQIVGNNQNVFDFSHTTFPQELNYCQACHNGTGSQDINWLTQPTRATCGSCHDDVNFVSGENHAAGAQADDSGCARCHIAEGELEFDASVKGAHTVPRFSRDLPGVKFEIVEVKNTQPGQNPTVTLKITDGSGFPIETSQMNSLSLVMAGPNTDYARYWSESLLTTPSSGGIVTYTFTRGIPADAQGSFTIGVEGYRNITLQPGTDTEMSNIRDVGFNQVVAVAVTDPTPVPRRTIATQEACNSCHGSLALHGTFRQNVQYCPLCHNANQTDQARRPADQLPVESVHLKTMIHKIHTGEELEPLDYTVYGFGNNPTSFNEVLFPGDRRNCEKCHVPDTQQMPLPNGVLPSVAPRDYINPMPPITAACLSCHTSVEAASHALVNTSTLGESCRVCHGPSSEFSVDQSHAR